MSGLSEKQKRFCSEYLIDLNGTQAAIRAGYSPKTAAEQASRLLSKVNVTNYLQTKKNKIETKLEINLERCLKELGRIAFTDLRKFYDEKGNLIPIHELDEDTAAAIAGMDIEELFENVFGQRNQIGVVKKIKRWDKNKALEMLMKHLGGFEKDNKQQNKDIKVTLNL